MGFTKLLPAVVLLVSSCSALAAQAPARADSSSAGSRLANTEWRLTSFGAEGAESPVIEGTTITLKFGADGRAGGSGGCNSYGGEYSERGDTLSIGQIISTKRACLEQGANEQEQRYLSALESAGSFKLSDGRLTIFRGDGPGALNFVTDPPSESAERQDESPNSPLALAAFFDGAVNAKEFERARGAAGGVQGVPVVV
jgi:heat shock protein HslJ